MGDMDNIRGDGFEPSLLSISISFSRQEKCVMAPAVNCDY